MPDEWTGGHDGEPVPANGPAWPAGGYRNGPLAGLKVLDLSRILAGPFATMHLADLGADVIKVELPGRGDETRHWGPPFGPDGTAAYFTVANRNKRALTVDLGSPPGAAIVRRLAVAADVVVDNFLPGRLARFGLDPDALRTANPRLVTCTITGFGSDSDAAGRPGFDFLAQAAGGLMAITGAEDGVPTKVGVAIVDLAAGLFATTGILAALRRRDHTGQGAHVEVPLFDSVVGLLANQAANWLVGGVEPAPMGNAHPNIVPYESFPTADRPLALAVGTDRQFARLVAVLGVPELADDARFRTNADRVRHRRALRSELTARLAAAPRSVWLDRLDEAGVPAAPVNSVPEVFADPLVAQRLLVEVDGCPQVRSPLRLDGQPLPVTGPPPALGRDTDAILTGLGLSAGEIGRLRSAGVV
ncbi:CaiB/BaiF CoA-transferase family protein [Micromonospora sp. CPCC 206060]|uniref:CaiB/BaiF CoA transferase family protein n=1 Tax=Micromonospora sp. CPCC 206060 TaxID=3122406 RepID=UPI002FF18199